MMRRLGILALVLTAGITYGESMRPLFTRENRFPEWGRAEIGALAQFKEYAENDEARSGEDQNEMRFTPYVRYQALENLDLYASVPWVTIDSDETTEAGVGDVVAGFELLAWQDIFDYPYIIPHADVSLPSGDEDKGMGAGDPSVGLGLSIGTVVHKVWHFVGDVGYRIQGEEDNIASAGLSLIFDVSKQLSFLAEVTATDEEREDRMAEHPVFFGGGLCYQATKNLAINLYGAGGKNSQEDVITTLKIAYSF